jgi:thioredoxin-related protein
MYKKSIITIVLIILFSVLLFLGYLIIDRLTFKRKIEAKLEALPASKLFDLDSLVYTINSSSSVCLIYFDSNCEYCQYELMEIKKNISLFTHSQIVFISSQDISSIKKASEDYGLTEISNIDFVKINSVDVFDTFGSASLPHIFIYDSNQKLIKEFKGETKVEAILKYLE